MPGAFAPAIEGAARPGACQGAASSLVLHQQRLGGGKLSRGAREPPAVAAAAACPPRAQVDPACLGALGLGEGVLTRSRANGFANTLETMKKRARAALAELPRFPSLLIGADSLEPQGSFAVAQVREAHMSALGSWGRLAGAARAQRGKRESPPLPAAPERARAPAAPPAPRPQAKYLRPDEGMVQRLVELLRSKQSGIVAHFYMDPEVQVRGGAQGS